MALFNLVNCDTDEQAKWIVVDSTSSFSENGLEVSTANGYCRTYLNLPLENDFEFEYEIKLLPPYATEAGVGYVAIDLVSAADLGGAYRVSNRLERSAGSWRHVHGSYVNGVWQGNYTLVQIMADYSQPTRMKIGRVSGVLTIYLWVNGGWVQLGEPRPEAYSGNLFAVLTASKWENNPVVVGGLLNYAITPYIEAVRASLVQTTYLGTDEIRALFRQSDGVAEPVRSLINQVCESATRLRAEFLQRCDSNALVRAEVIQTYKSLEAVRTELNQIHAISGGVVRNELVQACELLEFDRIRAEFEQIYLAEAGEAIVLRDEITITAILDGFRYPITSCYNLHDEAHEDSYHIIGQLLLADEAEYKLCKHHETIIEIVDGDETMRLMVEYPKRNSYEGGRIDYIVDLVSESVLLDSEAVAATSLSGMAKDIVIGLAAPVCAVDWQLCNWKISLSVQDETVLALIRRITESVKGVIQTGPDGTLICRPQYPDDMDKLADREPDLVVTDQDDIFQIIESVSVRDGFNSFYITDNAVASGGLRIETETLSRFCGLVRVFMTPWDEVASVALHHSGEGLAWIVKKGVVAELIESELVEFISGSGQLQKPCYGELLVDYDERDLGAISFQEDGTLICEKSENSLAKISYLTRYYSFEVGSLKLPHVQVYPEVIYV